MWLDCYDRKNNEMLEKLEKLNKCYSSSFVNRECGSYLADKKYIYLIRKEVPRARYAFVVDFDEKRDFNYWLDLLKKHDWFEEENFYMAYELYKILSIL